MSMREMFWNKRYAQQYEHIQTHMQSLYTWALLMKEEIEKHRQWAADKKQITGLSYHDDYRSLCRAEYGFANSIIDRIFAMSNGQIVKKYPTDFVDEPDDEQHESDEPNEPDEPNETNEESCEITNAVDTNANEVPEELRSQLEVEAIINERRANLADQKPTSQKSVHFNLSLTDDTARPDNVEPAECNPTPTKKIDPLNPPPGYVPLVLPESKDPRDKPPLLGKYFTLRRDEKELLLDKIFRQAVQQVTSLYPDLTGDARQEKINNVADQLLRAYHIS